jgi:hypothetical protein
VVLLLAALAGDALAGPWTRKAGETFLWAGFSSIGYGKIYDDGGVKQEIPVNVRDNVIRLLGEYGLAEGLTVTMGLPYAFPSTTPDSGAGSGSSKSGISDVDLGIRKGWHFGADVLALDVISTVPTGSNANAEGLLLGAGEWAFFFAPSWGRSFHPIPFYVTATAGLRLRTGGYSHEFRYGLEAGYGLFDGAATLILELAGQESFNNQPTFGPNPRPDDIEAAKLGLYTNNREYLAITPKVLFRPAPSWGIVLSYATAGKGRNVAGGAVLGGGVYHVF